MIINLNFMKMKKNLIRAVLFLAAFFSFSIVNAQTANQTAKFFDNVYLGVKGGVSSPLTFNETFPTNATFGLILGKEVVPALAFELEGTTWIGSNSNKGTSVAFNRFDSDAHNAFRAVNVGLNAKVNLLNLLNGYPGKPQPFEIGVIGGFGWLHTLVPNHKNMNDLSVKTALTAALNIGHNRAHTLFVSPVIYWNLTGAGTNDLRTNKVMFHKDYAQFGVEVGYIYHFKTSNGTRYFKTYDVGAMIYEIDRLNEELAKKPTEVIKEVEVEKVIDDSNVVTVPGETVVFFAYNKYDLDSNSKQVLDRIPRFCTVDIVGTASVEGTAEYNQKLSEKRAKVVEDYLRDRGVTINTSTGKGSSLGETSNRVAIVTIVEK